MGLSHPNHRTEEASDAIPSACRYQQRSSSKRSLCLTGLARALSAYTWKATGRAAQARPPLHRLKRLWRFVANERVDPEAVQLALIPYTLSSLGKPRLLGLAMDWAMWDTITPKGKRVHYQVLRIAVPRRGRALPLLQLAHYRDRLPAGLQPEQDRARGAAMGDTCPADGLYVFGSRWGIGLVSSAWLSHCSMTSAIYLPDASLIQLSQVGMCETFLDVPRPRTIRRRRGARVTHGRRARRSRRARSSRGCARAAAAADRPWARRSRRWSSPPP